MTPDIYKLFPDLDANGYDGSPEAVARRKAERDEEHRRLMADYYANKTQSILNRQVPMENRGDCFERFDCEDDPGRKAVLDACRRFAASPDGKTLVIIGGCGRGKTLLAVSIARAYLETHIDDVDADKGMAYTTEQSLLERYDRARSYKSLESTDDVMRSLVRVEMLIVDELGKRATGRDDISVLEELVDHRAGAVTTVFLSNLTPDDFRARYTGGFMSRVSGCCYALSGHDHRLGKGV